MTWFTHLATRTKLFLCFGLMVVLLLVVIAAAFHGLSSLKQSQHDLFKKDFLSSLEFERLLADRNRNRV